METMKEVFKIRCDKTYSELWNLTENEDILISETAHMAIKTINKLNEQNELYELTLKICKEAIQKNLAYAMHKDEEALYVAFKAIEKSLSKS